MNVLWRSLARMSAKLIFLLSVAGCFGTLAYASEGIITTVAGSGAIGRGNGGFSGDGGLAISAQLNYPNSVAVDITGNLYIADTLNNRIRKVDTLGNISTIAGDGFIDQNGWGKFSGDGGLAINAQLDHPQSIAVDVLGNIYIADTGNHRIRKIDTSGNISTVAGNGDRMGIVTEGSPATSVSLNSPENVYVDIKGNLYIAVYWHHTVYKVDTAGNIFTVAGTTDGFSGDGGIATKAQLSSYLGVVADDKGNVYISDGNNNRIRKVDSSGIISTVAGGGYRLGDGGVATKAELKFPLGVTIDSSGNLYIADAAHHRIRRVDVAGNISTVAGNGFADDKGYGGFSGDDGLATDAQLNIPASLAIDSSGNLYSKSSIKRA